MQSKKIDLESTNVDFVQMKNSLFVKFVYLNKIEKINNIGKKRNKRLNQNDCNTNRKETILSKNIYNKKPTN